MKIFTRINILWLAVVAVLASCGKEANVEDGEKVDFPTFPIKADGFYLNAGNFTKSYSGSILMWEPNASAKKMARVVRASDEKLEVGVEKLKYLRDKVLTQQNSFYDKRSVIQELKARGGQLFFKLSLQSAATWFAGIDGMGGELRQISQKLATVTPDGSGLQSADIGQAGNYFYLYCEAKLWQRAVYYLLAHDKHVRRPTPLALCEGMYVKGNLLSETTPACAPGSKEQPKSYFQCLWQEGVLKTKLFQSRYGAVSANPEVGAALAAASTDELRAFFGDKVNRNDRLFLEQDHAESLKIPVADGVKEVALKWAFNPARANEDPPSSLGNASVSEIIASMESPNEFASDGMRILSTSARPEAERQLLNAELKTLRNKVRSLAILSAHRYVNEVRFNGPFLAQGSGEVDAQERYLKEAAANFPSVFNVTSPELMAIQKEALQVKNELLAIGADVQAKVALLEPKDCEDKTNAKGLGCRDAALTKESMDSLTPDDVSVALFQSNIKLEKDVGKNQLRITAYVDQPKMLETTALTGCIQLTDDKYADCKDRETNAAVKVDALTGIITLSKTIKDPSEFGLGAVPRANLFNNGVNFNAIPLKEIRGAKVVLEFSLNNVDNVVQTLMGSMSFQESSGKHRTLYEGSIKLVEDEPSIVKDMKAFEGALRALAAAQ